MMSLINAKIHMLNSCLRIFTHGVLFFRSIQPDVTETRVFLEAVPLIAIHMNVKALK